MSTTKSFHRTVLSGRARRLCSRTAIVSMFMLASCNGFIASDDVEGESGLDPMALSSTKLGEERADAQLTAAKGKHEGDTAALLPGSVTTSPDTGWSKTGSLAAGRLLHTSVRLNDGRVLVVGGYSSSVELFDPATGTWSPTGQAPGNYRGATATLLPSGKVLVAGAADSGVSAALFDPATGTWSATGGLATPRYNHSATLLPDGRVLVAGGGASEYGSDSLASAELYDPATGTWTAAGALGAARRGQTATLLSSGKVLVAGGQGPSGRLAAAELYDPANGAWVSAEAMGTARANHTATALPSGKVLVSGGGLDGEPAARAEVYDPATQSWSVTQSMGKPRRHHTATLLASGKVLVAGGFDNMTGIQRGAELYDPARGVWEAIPGMAVGRYQHTATLLDNGHLLVAGGFSNQDQASAELFAASYIEVLLDSGPGWRLINVSGSNTGGDSVPYNEDLYAVTEAGIEDAPLPQSVRAKLATDDTDGTVYFLDKKIMDELSASEIAGKLSPALQAIAEPAASSRGGLQTFGDDCPDVPAYWGKTVDFMPLLNFSTPLGEGFTGTVGTSGSVQANATVDLMIRKLNVPLFGVGPCVFGGFTFGRVRARGVATIDYGATLTGTISYNNSWEHEVAKPHLLTIPVPIPPFVVPLQLNLPITVGVDLGAEVSGHVYYTAQQSTVARFDATCTLDGCEASTDLDAPEATEMDVDGGISGRIRPTVWAQAALRAAIVSDGYDYLQVGLRPNLHGDLWGYTGECGDADGDGASEMVHAATFGLDARFSLNGEGYLFGHDPKKWNDIWTSKRYKLGFWDLAGNGAIYQPMLIGPGKIELPYTMPYKIRMRPCWPHDDDVTYKIEWGNGEYETLAGHPDLALTRYPPWTDTSAKTLKLTALHDAHGRALGGEVTRTIQVASPSYPPQNYRKVTINGTLVTYDDDGELFPGKYKTLSINREVFLDPYTRDVSFTINSECTGGEVNADVDVYLHLEDGFTTVKTQAFGRLYEGESCAREDLDATDQAEVFSAAGEAKQVGFEMVNGEWDTDDKGTLSITVTNQQR